MDYIILLRKTRIIIPSIIDDRILKLDKRHIRYGFERNNGLTLHGDIVKLVYSATIVMYKEDWEDPNCKLKLIKFRYDNSELPYYTKLVESMPVHDKHTAEGYAKLEHLQKARFRQ